MSDDMLIFSTTTYDGLRQEVCRQSGFERGDVETSWFPDHERYMRIATQVDGRDVAIIAGTVSDADTLELFDLACGVVKYGARRLTMVVPYFGYSTMDRAVKPGEVVTAKTRARLLSSVPDAAYGNRLFLVDTHTEGLPHYFEGGLRTVHLYASPVTRRAARALGGDEFVLACTDAGRAKWVESLANDLGVTASFVYKRRLDGQRTEITGVSADVEGRPVVIYDDMIRTGGSLIQAARAYKDAGATQVAAVATHGVFPEDAAERIEQTGLFEKIVVTDSHPRATLASEATSVVEVHTIAEVLAGALKESP